MATRQTFSAADDLLLLARVESAAPWRLRNGVMEVWQQTAHALNADPDCSLSGLNATSARARFFRLVAQRRERPDTMRRGASDEGQFQTKLAMLDRLIARMDAENEETSLHRLLSEVDAVEDAPSLQFSLSQTPMSRPLPVQRPLSQQPAASYAMLSSRDQSRAATQAFFHSATMNPAGRVGPPMASSLPVQTGPSSVPRRPSVQRPVNETPTRQLPAPSSAVIPADSPVSNDAREARTMTAEAPTKKRARENPDEPLPSIHASQGSWERIVDRALLLMQRKFELDRENAEADRALRREEMRARMEDMKLMRAQTDQLIMAVLDLAKSK